MALRHTSIARLTPKLAWEGTRIAELAKIDPNQTRAILLREIAELCKAIDANKTISDSGELIYATETIIEEFPVLRIEEFLLVLRDMRIGKYGKFYERLKIAEIVSCLHQYEVGPRLDYVETMHKQADHREPATKNTPLCINYVPPKVGRAASRSIALPMAEIMQIEEMRGFIKPRQTSTNQDKTNDTK